MDELGTIFKQLNKITMQETIEDEAIRDEQTIRLVDALNIVKSNFTDIHNQLKHRSTSDQIIIGNFVTVLESNIKKEFKQLNK